ITRYPVTEEVASSGEPSRQRVALLSRLAIQVEGLALAACDHGSGFVIVSQCDVGWSVAEIGGAAKEVHPEHVIARRSNAGNGVHATLVQRFRRGALRK